jgi:hypothetical protein
MYCDISGKIFCFLNKILQESLSSQSLWNKIFGGLCGLQPKMYCLMEASSDCEWGCF